MTLTQIWLVGAGLAMGLAAGMLLERSRRRPSTSKHVQWTSEMVWALCDDLAPEVCAEQLASRIEPRDGILPMLLQGALWRKAGRATQALKIHQSLFARSGLSRDTLRLIHLQCAIDALQAGLFEEVSQHLEGVGFRWKRTAVVQVVRARLAFKQGNLKQARSEYENLHKRFPRSVSVRSEWLDCLARMANELRQWGKYRAARKITEQVLALDPLHAQGLLARAWLSLDENDPTQMQFYLLQYTQRYGEHAPEVRDLLDRTQKVLKQA